MSGFLDTIKSYARDTVTSTGVKVYIKTDLGPEIQVFDSDAPADQQSQGGALPIKYAVRITDRNGVELVNYGDYPQTNLIKAAMLWGAVGTGAFLLLAGVLRLVESMKP